MWCSPIWICNCKLPIFLVFVISSGLCSAKLLASSISMVIYRTRFTLCHHRLQMKMENNLLLRNLSEIKCRSHIKQTQNILKDQCSNYRGLSYSTFFIFLNSLSPPFFSLSFPQRVFYIQIKISFGK